tara:strand:- start:994 stop:1173 length:180 start_codon:yes stop_codon:yes gene_type:complete
MDQSLQCLLRSHTAIFEANQTSGALNTRFKNVLLLQMQHVGFKNHAAASMYVKHELCIN